MNYQQAATDIKRKMAEQEGEVFLDPLTISIISAIISLIFNIIRTFILFRRDKKGVRHIYSDGEAIKEACRNPTPRMRRIIRRVVRRKLSREEYDKYGDKLCASILQYGADTGVGRLQQLYEYKEVEPHTYEI